MANWNRRLQDGEIVQYLMNLDESECEDIDEEDKEDLNLEQEVIFEEVIPRPLDESDWESSDDEPLFSIARANTARRSKLKKDGRGSFDCVVRQDKMVAVVKWLDSKPIHLASSESAVEPLGTADVGAKRINVTSKFRSQWR